MNCGLARKSEGDFLGNTNFYEERYENYYRRPGVDHYDRGRYMAMAEWMKSALGEFEPAAILDIGCGAGWSMAATALIYAGVTIEGIEPSTANADRARQAGYIVYPGRIGSEQGPRRVYDLIYANNVLQHVVDPIAFLRDVSSHLDVNGCFVCVLPDANEPSNEMLWCDHNYSFRPDDLRILAEKAGFRAASWQANPPNNALLNKQLVILQKAEVLPAHAAMPESTHPVEELYDRRSHYIATWRALDGHLFGCAQMFSRVFNFGASMWTWLLAGYCPRYWSIVDSCLVDGESGRCVDKPVLPTAEIDWDEKDCVVLGINPANQTVFAKRLGAGPARVLSWSDRITV